MSHDLHESLRDNVRILGDSLGRTIADDLGQSFVDKIETIRAHAKRGRQGDSLQQRQLIEYLRQLPERARHLAQQVVALEGVHYNDIGLTQQV